MPTEKPYLIATGDTSKTKLHKPLSDSKPHTPACKSGVEYRGVSERVGKQIIGITEPADDPDWKCLRCFFKDERAYGNSPASIGQYSRVCNGAGVDIPKFCHKHCVKLRARVPQTGNYRIPSACFGWVIEFYVRITLR